MNTAVEQIDLSPLCRIDGDSLYDIDEPFVINGVEYATNAMILAWRKTDLPNTKGKYPSVEKIVDVFGFIEMDHIWLACGDCKGTGTQKCNLGHEHDCPKCGSAGCIGVLTEQDHEFPSGIRFNGHLFNRDLVRLVGKIHPIRFGVMKHDGGGVLLCENDSGVRAILKGLFKLES
jgi:hypothetical protein